MCCDLQFSIVNFQLDGGQVRSYSPAPGSSANCRLKMANRRRRAFSLVEIMIVVVIIGLLAGVVTINVRSYLTKAKHNTARQGVAVIMEALDTFWAEYGRYPTNEEGLAVLATPTEKLPEPPLANVPTDPWGRPFQYNCPGSNGPYEVMCLGADGREGGEGADADVTSENLRKGSNT